MRETWIERTLNPFLNKHKERYEKFQTDSGIDISRLYEPENVQIDYQEQLGFPGDYPFTRGIYPTMYRGKFWTMRQYAGYADARESNRRYRYLLDQGTTGLSVAFDLPTQMGYDSDHDLADGEVGRVGVAIDSLADMETLFDQIPMEKISSSMTINATASILLCMYIAVAKKHGVSLDRIRQVENRGLRQARQSLGEQGEKELAEYEEGT